MKNLNLNDPLSIWTIYFGVSDQPVGYCARRHEVTDRTRATPDLIIAPLDALRERFESMGLINMGRELHDLEVIVESWI